MGLVGYAKLLPSGRADYGAVQPGPRDVVLVFRNDRPPWPRAGFWHVGRWRPEAQPGRSEIVLRVPDLFALDVRFDGAAADTVLTLEHAPRRADASSQSVDVGSDGVARFEMAPAGRYTVRHHEAGAMVVDVPAPGIVAFAPALFNALRIDGAGGYWAEAGLQDGDLIVGINGKRFEPGPDTSRWFPRGLAPADATVTLLVRGPSGRERDVEVAQFRFLGGKGEDGHLEPVFR